MRAVADRGIVKLASNAARRSLAIEPRAAVIPLNCPGHPQFALQFAKRYFLVHNLFVILIVPMLGSRE
jgi:hypothetical protein